MASKKRSVNPISLEEKYNIIKDVEVNKMKHVDIVKKYKLRYSSNINSILKRRDEIVKRFESSDYDVKRKRLRNGNYEKIEEVLITWMRVIWTPEMRLNGPLIREKALELAENYKVDGFQASDGWFERFKKRFQIKYKTIHGESESVDTNVVENWKMRLDSLIEGYSSRDIYNGDEFGLFWLLSPKKSMLLKGQSCKGGKLTTCKFNRINLSANIFNVILFQFHFLPSRLDIFL